MNLTVLALTAFLGPLWSVITIIAIGVIFLLAEIFIFPGFGVAGMLGIAVLIFGVFLGHHFFGSWVGLLILLGTIIFILVLLKTLLKTRAMKKKFVLGISSAKNPAVIENIDTLSEKEGVALTVLKPSGIVEIDNERYNAVSDGDFLEKGTRVKVDIINGAKIVVSRLHKKKEK